MPQQIANLSKESVTEVGPGTVLYAAIAASSSGNNTIVSAVTGKKIRVLTYVIIANGTVNAKWQDGASGTDLSGLLYLVVNTGASIPFCPVGQLQTSASTLLNLNLSAGVAVGGHLTYVLV